MAKIVETVNTRLYVHETEAENVKTVFHEIVKENITTIAECEKVKIKAFLLRDNYMMIQFKSNGKYGIVTVAIL